MIGLGDQIEGLYRLDLAFFNTASYNNVLFVNNISTNTNLTIPSSALWHFRLGHVSHKRLTHMSHCIQLLLLITMQLVTYAILPNKRHYLLLLVCLLLLASLNFYTLIHGVPYLLPLYIIIDTFSLYLMIIVDLCGLFF